MKVTNFWGVPNQFVIIDGDREIFQSYDSIIAIIDKSNGSMKSQAKITLGKNWDYSVTTGKYRNKFLNETKKETEAKIKSGEYTIDPTL